MEKETSGAAFETSRSSKHLIAGDHHELQGDESVLRLVETFLRLLPIPLSVTALIIMLKNSLQNDYGYITYSHFGAFRYLVHANGICAGYSLFSAVFVALPRPSTMPRAWTFFLLDQVLTYIILAAGAVSASVLYLAEKGNMEATWSSACGSFGPFCHKVTASTAVTFVAVVCYVMLSLISSYKLFSRYDAPVSNPKKGIDNIAAVHA
ncbi:hypothetical protein RJT34_11461 [Clitoria ternatea]|uniref:CASP-like protein n=1 Tax=Clitoria ternatea TaxID=43366 RepID=A0AAN9JMQ4_CLITE